MKKMALFLAIAVASIHTIWADEVKEETKPSPQELAALRKEIRELRELIAALQAAQPKRQVSIGVMPIENDYRIPQVGSAFRQILISSLREVGIQAYESLDEETLRWIKRQDQLVREGLIDHRTAPRRGELVGITHYLLGTVTRYDEVDVEDVKVLFGIIVIKFGSEARIRIGSLVVDFRLVDAQSGLVVDSFRTEAKVRQKEIAGMVIASGGWYHRQEVLPEKAAREVAKQAAQRFAKLFTPAQLVKPSSPGPPPQPEKPAPKL